MYKKCYGATWHLLCCCDLGSQRYILNAIYTTLSLSKPIFSAFFKKNEKNMFKNLHYI